jgi:periplasmic protein TonB
VPNAPFDALIGQLLDAGVSAKYVARLRAELQEHAADLEAEALSAEKSLLEARQEARVRLGEERAIAAEFFKRPELRSWVYQSRWLSHLLKAVVWVLLKASIPGAMVATSRTTLVRYAGAAGVATVALGVFLLAISLPLSGARNLIGLKLNAADVQQHTPRSDGKPPAATTAASPGTTARIDPAELRAMTSPTSEFGTPAGQWPALPKRYSALLDGEYRPLVRVAPTYPPKAALLGLEGYVVVAFTVTRKGAVKDVEVVESSDELFVKSAVEAAYRFRYMPRVVDGKPVEVSGVRSKIIFRLPA